MVAVQNQQAKLKGKNVYLLPISSNTFRVSSMEEFMPTMGSTRENASALEVAGCGAKALAVEEKRVLLLT